MERNKYLFLQILDKNHSKKVLKTEVPGNEVALVDVSPPFTSLLSNTSAKLRGLKRLSEAGLSFLFRCFSVGVFKTKKKFEQIKIQRANKTK